jgi:tRNA G37 N-methylase Trm5
VHACEWDEDTLLALKQNLAANGVAERCPVHPGDNAASLIYFEGRADRVSLGLIPSSEAGWPVAVRALKPAGGWMHVHGNVGCRAEGEWCARLGEAVRALAAEAGREWRVEVRHLERVKSYAPGINHVVADVYCCQKRTREEGSS